ncbi:hypothetical protein GQ55_8G000500 [Panicum hallii var. hallii]|uniref:Uncharacterized protein n=1 Tax=Panicum hallii var. hallii TaxID=1504633 RepID=A0A2T7CJ20_9POAL|nr:hypothetical protein GQ55_8G000500 [Panicum hallii var. hallii]
MVFLHIYIPLSFCIYCCGHLVVFLLFFFRVNFLLQFQMFHSTLLSSISLQRKLHME